MINNRLAATAGAGLGIIPALLINRYALGNTSGKSAVIAALLGGGLGAAGGVGLNTYLKGKALAEQQEDLNALIRRTDEGNKELEAFVSSDVDLNSEETRRAVRNSIAKSISSSAEEVPDELVDATLNDLEARRFIKSIDKSPEKVLTMGTDTSVVPIDQAILDELDVTANRFRANGEISRSQERVHGGYLSDDNGKQGEEVFQQMLHSDLGNRAAGGDRQKLAALINYHNKLYQVASSDLVKKLPTDMRSPEMLDYIALRAMPDSQRSLVPVAHRLSSIARDKSTKGWSYSYDFQTMTNPNYFKESSRLPNMQEQLTDLAVAATSPAGSAALPIFFGSLANAGISKHFQKSLPEWDSSFDSSEGDTLGNRYYRNEVVKKLTDPNSGIPIYSWQAPELAKQMIHKGAVNLASTAVDSAFDVKRILSSNPKMHSLFLDKAINYGKKNNKLKGLRKFRYWANKNKLAPFFDASNYLSGGMNALSGYVGVNDIMQGRMMRDPELANKLQQLSVLNRQGNNAFTDALESQIQYLQRRRRR